MIRQYVLFFFLLIAIQCVKPFPDYKDECQNDADCGSDQCCARPLIRPCWLSWRGCGNKCEKRKSEGQECPGPCFCARGLRCVKSKAGSSKYTCQKLSQDGCQSDADCKDNQSCWKCPRGMGVGCNNKCVKWPQVNPWEYKDECQNDADCGSDQCCEKIVKCPRIFGAYCSNKCVKPKSEGQQCGPALSCSCGRGLHCGQSKAGSSKYTCQKLFPEHKDECQSDADCGDNQRCKKTWKCPLVMGADCSNKCVKWPQVNPWEPKDECQRDADCGSDQCCAKMWQCPRVMGADCSNKCEKPIAEGQQCGHLPRTCGCARGLRCVKHKAGSSKKTCQK